MKKITGNFIATLLIVSLCNISWLQPLHAFTIGEERDVGEKLLYTVRTAFPLVDDPDISQYITELGREVLTVAGIQYFDYHFFVINDEEFNAFAAPSGLVFFYSGLIGTMKTENELVSVLAHEIGHVAKRHLASRMEKGKIIGAASLAVALAAIALGGGGAAAQTLLAGSLAAGQSANLHFSRQDEIEADLMAYGWMKALNRNPVGQKKMLETMRRIARYRSDRLPQYLLTHPESEARLDYVQSLLEIDREELAQFSSGDEFDFVRFKYRVMASVKESTSFQPYLASILADPRSTEFDVVMAKFGLSQIALRENNHDRSLELLEEVISYFPDKEILHTDKGVLLFTAGKYNEARKILESAVSVNPNNMYAMFTLGKTYVALGEYNLAQQYFTEISHEMPEYSKVYFELGKIASNRKESGDSFLYLGKYYLYEGKLKLARSSLKTALSDATSSDKAQKESNRLLELIDRLVKK